MEGKYFRAENKFVAPAISIVLVLSVVIAVLILSRFNSGVIAVLIFLDFFAAVFVFKNTEFKHSPNKRFKT